MIFADTSLAFDPAYPWSIPMIGPAAMFGAALALVAITAWTYLGVQQATSRRIAAVIVLRFGALAVAFCILLRPSIAMTQLDGVGESKLLLVLDRSKSMDVADEEGKPTRWQHVDGILKSSTVERRLRRLAQEEKIEFVKYLGDRDLTPLDKDATPNGTRTDIGAWLEQLAAKHRSDKSVRGIVLFSDGGDNGTRYSAAEKAFAWRGIAPIHAFGAGDPSNAKLRKDLAVTKLDVKPEPIFVNTPIRIEALVQAPGFAKTDFKGQVVIESLSKDGPKAESMFDVTITNEKEQRLVIPMQAPEEAGEYKVTLKVTPHADETNHENNEISTYIQVIKEKLNVLWVDRPRVWEPIQIIRLALAPEERLKIKYVTVRPTDTGDPFPLYEFSKHYDVIVIGDIGLKQFTLGNSKFLDEVVKTVRKNKTGLLMLGGSETFANGGWTGHAEFMKLLPVDFDLKGKPPAFSVDSKNPIYVKPTKEGFLEPFVQLDPGKDMNLKIWKDEFKALHGLAPVGTDVNGATRLLEGNGDKSVLVATQAGEGRVAVFAGDSTATSWLGSPEAARGFTRFWKQLVFWLAKQEDRSTQLVVKLDKRRMTDDPGDVLGFTLTFRDKDGAELPRPTFEAKVVADKVDYPVQLDGRRGTFKNPKKLGEHELIVTASATDAKKNFIKRTEMVRFLVAADQTETLRPLADHETLTRIASASGGRFHLAQEDAFLQYLDELASQVKREGRVRTTHWPAWNRVPASEHPRDQLAGLLHSFALFGFLIFVMLLGAEWLLRRMWGMA